jgi:large subunit ribosomal protein L23
MKSVFKKPVLTEKARELTKQNQYQFIVEKWANKSEIKKAIEDFYDVDVLDVKIIKVPAKQRTLGRISGWRKSYKKAIVKLKEGQKIEITR